MNIPPVSGSPLDNQQIIDSIDDFIAGLNTPPGTTVATAVVTRTSAVSANDTPKIEVPKTDEEMRAFVLKHSAELVESSVRSIMELQKLTVATGDPEMMDGLANLIAASTGAIDAVSKLHLQSKKAADAIELKKMDIEGKKEIQKLKNEAVVALPAGPTNILIATREEIIAELTGKAKSKPIDDVYEVTTVTSVLSS